jgi:hypothetical protein
MLFSAIDDVLLINDVLEIFRLLKYWKAIYCSVEIVTCMVSGIIGAL